MVGGLLVVADTIMEVTMDTIHILDVRYNPPLLGDVPLVSVQYLQETETPDIWLRHTVCLALWNGAVEHHAVRSLPLIVIEAMASVLPDTEEEEEEEEEEENEDDAP